MDEKAKDQRPFEEAEDPGVGQGNTEDRRLAKPEARETGRDEDARPAPFLGRGELLALLLWGFLVLAFSAAIAAEVAFWWLIPIFGAAAPAALVMLRNRALGPRGGRSSIGAGEEERAGSKERELLGALRERGALSPTTAAMHTTLTVGEAAGMLEGLARKGHLEARAHEGTLVYALRERDRRALEEPEWGSSAKPTPGEPSVQPLVEPLSERELEVLRLLAAGKPNREISQELHVALGTVKAHAANIYRKLEARNRAEAVSRARELGLLRDGDRPL